MLTIHRISSMGRWCALVLTALLITMANTHRVSAQSDSATAAAKGPDTSVLKGEYAIMVNMLKIEKQQLVKFIEAVEARNAAVKKWELANADKIAANEQAAAAAKKANDKDAAKKARSVKRQLTEERNKAIAAPRAKIFDVFTSEQKIQWQGFNFYRGAMYRFKRVGLSEDQTTQIRQLCQDASNEAGLIDAADKDKRAAASKKLAAKIDKEVLTDDQREKLK